MDFHFMLWPRNYDICLTCQHNEANNKIKHNLSVEYSSILAYSFSHINRFPFTDFSIFMLCLNVLGSAGCYVYVSKHGCSQKGCCRVPSCGQTV